MSGRLAVILCCVVLLARPAMPGADQSGQTHDGHAYLAVVDQYQRGEFDAAVAAFMLWRVEELRAVRPAELVEQGSVRRAHAAAVLHTEAMLKGGSVAALLPAVRRGLFMLRGKNDLGDVEFLVLLRVVTASFLLRHGEPQLARQMLDPVGDDPRLALVDGAISEHAGTYGLGGGTPVTMREGTASSRWNAFGFEQGPQRTALLAAEARYRSVLGARPDLAEARLRLGRVLTMTDRPADARLELERVLRDAPHSYLRYMAALFLGTLDERAGRFDGAAKWYQLAIDEYPEAQTARLALGHLLESHGRADAGWAEVRRIFAAPEHPGAAARDPWWEYRYGQAWQFGVMVEKLREVVIR